MGVEAGQLGGDAGLDVRFEIFGAGAVGFGTGLEGVDEGLGEADGGFAGGGLVGLLGGWVERLTS